jgi:hypothetical protein
MNQSTLMVHLLHQEHPELELFHTPDGTPFATLAINAERVTLPVTGKDFGLHAGQLFYTEVGRVPSAQAVRDAQAALAG